MKSIKDSALQTFREEAEAVASLAGNLTDDFEKAVRAILDCEGKVIVTGMGKSGLIGKKIAASLASTGTPSFFLHPGEAYHGDLGMIESRDIVLAITYSGQTDEVLRLIPFLKSRENKIIAVTGNPDSLLAKHADFHLNVAVVNEVCPLNLAPTTSTTATLVMGDALTVALIDARNFKTEDFAIYHPGGTLGRRLLMRVTDVMRCDVPRIAPDMPLGEVIIAISNARLGIAAVERDGELAGVITDGDIRRAMAHYKENFFSIRAEEIMNRNPKTILPNERIGVAEDIMHRNKIHSLIVVDSTGEISGVVEYFNVS